MELVGTAAGLDAVLAEAAVGRGSQAGRLQEMARSCQQHERRRSCWTFGAEAGWSCEEVHGVGGCN